MSKLKDRADQASDDFMARIKRTKTPPAGNAPRGGQQRGVIRAIQREGVDRSLFLVDEAAGLIWEGNGRLPLLLDAEDVNALALDIERHGQHQPAVGRFVGEEPHRKVEIIAGGTRARACWQLDKPVLVRIVDDIDDKRARAIQCGENAKRADFSAYERGLIYQQMLERGDYKNASELAEAMGVNKGSVARALKVGRLPIEIVQAIGKKHLGYREGVDLAKLMEKNPDRIDSTVQHARGLAAGGGKPAYLAIRAVLLGQTRQRARRRSWQDYHAAIGDEDQVVLRVRDARAGQGLELVIPGSVIGPEREKILNEITQLLGRRATDHK